MLQLRQPTRPFHLEKARKRTRRPSTVLRDLTCILGNLTRQTMNQNGKEPGILDSTRNLLYTDWFLP
jgi:hypothetical protein